MGLTRTRDSSTRHWHGAQQFDRYRSWAVMMTIVPLGITLGATADAYCQTETSVRFPPHLARALVGAQTEERCMPQTTLGRPLDDLRHQLRLHPLHLPHLPQRDDFGFGRSTNGHSSTWCGFSALKSSRRRWGNEAGSHLAREPQAGLIVVADEQSIDAVRPGTVAADHELLLVLKLQLLPGVAPLSGFVQRVLALR